MTADEAIKAIKDNYPSSEYGTLREALDMGMDALDKQLPKKPIEEFFVNGNLYWYCPHCKEVVKSDIEGMSITNEYNHNHCGGCGQAIDWSDEK